MLKSTGMKLGLTGMLSLGLFGCALLSPAEPTVVGTPSAIAETSPSAPTSPPTLATPTLPPTVSPCPARQTVPYPDRPADFQDYTPTIVEYLNAGADPATLPALLEEWQALVPEASNYLETDLTGDGVAEVAVHWINAQSESVVPEGALTVFGCRDGQFETYGTYTPGEFTDAGLVGATDMNADGRGDLIFAEVNCGAHTCWHNPHVWSWQNDQLVDLIGGDLSYPYPIFTLQEGAVLVASQGIGSVGAGPQRVTTTTLQWTGTGVTVTDFVEAPATYRYHAFIDGENAWKTGDSDAALAHYQRVIDDPDLQPWGAPDDAAYAAQEKAWLTALARWRSVLVSLEIEDYIGAQDQYDLLQATVTPDSPAAPVAVFAERFWKSFLASNNLGGSCHELLTLPEAQTIVDFLNQFGYANPMYEVPDLCPTQ